VASAAYSSACQLNWLSAIAGQRQKRLVAVRWMARAMPALVAAGRRSARRADHACTRPSTTSESMTSCWFARDVSIEDTQPGEWTFAPGERGLGVGTYGGVLTMARASARARASLRAGPWWPAWAATEWMSRRLALVIVSVPPPPGR
jgi:hypothetical protein